MFDKNYKIITIYKIALFLLILITSGCNKNNEPKYELFINEFLAINVKNITDEYGEFDDWVEIFNGSIDSIDIGGLYISDKLDDSNPYMIPDTFPSETTIRPNGYIVLWCDRNIEQGPLHLDFKLSGNGESIILLDKDGDTIIDGYTFGSQTVDVSMGRSGDEWLYFESPTPGQPN